MASLTEHWAAGVLAECDPVFLAADAAFSAGEFIRRPHTGEIAAPSWRADPVRFGTRYPSSGVMESIENDSLEEVRFYLYPDSAGHVRLSLSSCWNLVDLLVRLDEYPELDAQAIADVFARLLEIPSPRLEFSDSPHGAK